MVSKIDDTSVYAEWLHTDEKRKEDDYVNPSKLKEEFTYFDKKI